MTTNENGAFGPHPDLRDLIVSDFNHYQSGSDVPITLSEDQIDVLQQRTFVDHPAIQINEAEAMCASFVQLHDVPPASSRGVLLHWASRPRGSIEWQTASYTAKSFPETERPLPFEEVTLAGPAFGIACGVQVVEAGVDITRLRLELSDGTILEDTSASGNLLLFAPQQAKWSQPEGWSDEHAPLVRLLDSESNDVLPPNRLFFVSQ